MDTENMNKLLKTSFNLEKKKIIKKIKGEKLSVDDSSIRGQLIRSPTLHNNDLRLFFII